jgi:hypothetical protein
VLGAGDEDVEGMSFEQAMPLLRRVRATFIS